MTTLGDEVEIFGAQLEQAAFPTSYIPTDASGKTRNADLCSIVSPSFEEWYRQGVGTVVCEVAWSAGSQNKSFAAFAADFNDGSSSNRILIYNRATTAGGVAMTASGVEQAVFSGVASTSSFVDVALSYQTNDVAYCINGGTVAFDSVASIPVIDRLFLGGGMSTSTLLNGHIRKLQYYPQRLTNTELQALTRG